VSSRRRPGPITTSHNFFACWSLPFFSNKTRRGVWVPAFAGTTSWKVSRSPASQPFV